jgi:Arsenical resistance operon protein ArsD
MTKLQIYDPAMCCSTGLCGPAVDPALPRFAADVEWLKTKGVEVERFNLAQQVVAFMRNATVKSTLNANGTECLPLILVDGSIVAEGSYPTRRDLARYTQVAYEDAPTILRGKEQPSLVTLGATQRKDGR